jgi:hypothetical protein
MSQQSSLQSAASPSLGAMLSATLAAQPDPEEVRAKEAALYQARMFAQTRAAIESHLAALKKNAIWSIENGRVPHFGQLLSCCRQSMSTRGWPVMIPISSPEHEHHVCFLALDEWARASGMRLGTEFSYEEGDERPSGHRLTLSPLLSDNAGDK